MPRFKSNYYTTSKYRYDYKTHERKRIYSDTLFANGVYQTKIKPEQLPDSYIEGLYYAYDHGYMNTAGIKYMIYRPNKCFNHMFKDDFLFISYDKPIEKDKYMFYKSDEYVWGTNIIAILKGAEKYSGYDISEIKKQIEDKRKWFAETYPEDYALEVGSHGNFFGDKERSDESL